MMISCFVGLDALIMKRTNWLVIANTTLLDETAKNVNHSSSTDPGVERLLTMLMNANVSAKLTVSICRRIIVRDLHEIS